MNGPNEFGLYALKPSELVYPAEATLVSIKEIEVPPKRGRKSFKNLEALADSIRTKGLVNPPTVTKNKDGDRKFRLVAGERRLRAMMIYLRMSEVPVMVIEELTELRKKELELEENVQREDLDWMEEIDLLRQIDDLKKEIYGEAKGQQGEAAKKAWSTEKTAELVGKPKSTVEKQVRFARKLRERPDIAEKVKGMPLRVAMRQFKQTLEAEKFQRLAESGKVPSEESCWVKLGDCRELIKELKDESVDLILTDPPFGYEKIEEGRAVAKPSREVVSYHSVLTEHDNLTAEKVVELFEELTPELARVLKPSGHFYVFCAPELLFRLKEIFKESGLEYRPPLIVWSKNIATAAWTGYNYSPCYETIMFGHKPPVKRRLAEPCKAIVESAVIHATKKLHPFEKPQELLRKLIKQSTFMGGVVLDPFAGSGSTIVAAKAVGRAGWGFELEAVTQAKAQARLGQN